MSDFTAKTRLILEQTLIAPICLFGGYIFSSLRKFNEVDYVSFGQSFPLIALKMFIAALVLYALFTLVLRTNIRKLLSRSFKIFEGEDQIDLVFVVCSVIVFILMYILTLTPTLSDYPAHTSWAANFDWRSIKKSLVLHTYPLWHCSVSLVAKIFHIPFNYSAALVSASFATLEYTIIRNIIKEYYKNIILEKQKYVDLFSMTFMFLQPIYFPWFNITQYLGQGTPNVWHNPTIMCCYPFALICTYLFIKMIDKYREGEKIIAADYVQIGVFLFISVIAKPCFLQVFIPAVAIMFIIMLICSKGKSFLFELKFVISCIPAGLWCIFVFIISFVPRDTNGGNGVGIGFLEVMSLYTPNVWISLIIVLMFPISFLLVSGKKSFNKNFFIIALIFICGWLESAFLKETGSRMSDGNFGWGYAICITLIYLFCAIRFFGDFINVRSKKMVLPTVIYTLSVLFGFRYYIELYLGHINL